MGKRGEAREKRPEAMGKKGFRELIVWQKAKDLAVTIYRVSEEGTLSRDYGLRDQIRRSALIQSRLNASSH